MDVSLDTSFPYRIAVRVVLLGVIEYTLEDTLENAVETRLTEAKLVVELIRLVVGIVTKRSAVESTASMMPASAI